MIEINEEEEAWSLQRLTGIKIENGPAMSEPGMMVDHAIHGRGRTKNSDPKVVGKVLVYFESGLKFACLPTNLIFVGFVD